MSMKRIWILGLACGLLSAQAGAEEPSSLKTTKEKLSYAIGVEIARNYQQQGIEYDADLVLKGMKDSQTGERLLLPENEVRRLLADVQSEVRQKQRFKIGSAAEQNLAKGAAFLAQNKTNQGVVTLTNGVQYKILRAGEGQKPTDGDTIECEFRGTRLDGAEIFSSPVGRPGVFKVKDAPLPVWREILPLMPVKSKWRLFVPAHLAYGERGMGRNLGPNETMIFDLEVLAIK
jgi:FKBP-type peptidyl-prolyl cis-trans isomerase FklB